MADRGISPDRKELADLLGVDTDAIIRVETDRRLAGLFGAVSFLGLNLLSIKRPTFTLGEIEKRLKEAGIDANPKDFVEESFYTNYNYKSPDLGHCYYFEKMETKDGEEKYRLQFYNDSWMSDTDFYMGG